MMILSRRLGESVIIEIDREPVKLKIMSIEGKQVILGIEAPKDIKILRTEVRERIEQSKIK
ncbi:carbon storage regulator [Gilvimarinus sp. DA14]|uniref:carbon storage regulator n=1 Tax=Gilvimarinus sp. DA14 TaxID=2956798 RepID=UPI0020B72C0A|nr:carbon storage regulator [Gilvimarinus sp. DA14]UTF61287.1 carbon storage regulator [Gilvimarinus sp. DA14]